MPKLQDHVPVWQYDRVLDNIGKAVYTPVAELGMEAWRTAEPVPFSKRRSGERIQPALGKSWGKLFDCAWFRFTGQVPAEAAGKSVVCLLDVNGEMLVVDEKGDPRQGLTSVASAYARSQGTPGKRVLSLGRGKAGQRVDLWADAGCNDLFGNLKNGGIVETACIAICHENLRALVYDFEVLLDFAKNLAAESSRVVQVIQALADASALLVEYTDAEAAQARAVLKPLLAKRGGDPTLTVSAIGHAHMDLAWLWPIRETIRKGARTFATVLHLMERYPDYRFGASQPQLFLWMKQHYPALYARIARRVKEGRFEVQGGMWVESDTNLIGGESMVRQFLYGKQFFKEEFGVDVRNCWLPDVFGYSAAMPQILRKCGIDYFMTQKQSWSRINKLPHHSFHWQGIDGTRVLAHLPPEDSYNSPALPRSLHKIDTCYKDRAVSGRALMLFGIGDGGGGPGEEHVERLLRVKNLLGVPPAVQEPAAKFFEAWEKDADKFSTWVGELYLEFHQGTYTTHARNKRFNRLMERSLRELEMAASLYGEAAKLAYPSAELLDLWREVLLYQFHDIIPGSSIKRVYDETTERYIALLARTATLILECYRRVAGQVDTAGLKAPVVVFNSLSWDRAEWVKAGGKWLHTVVPALGYTAVDAALDAEIPDTLVAEPALLENDCLRVRFAADGSIASIFDKSANREVLPQGSRANRLAAYQDTGDAWDFPPTYAAKAPQYLKLASAKACVDGPKAILRQEYRLGHSTLTQEVALTAGSARLEFRTEAVWREKATMLRTSFPVAVHANEATCGIQFGSVRRPTHSNTSWDLAKDEIAAQKWVDLSQRDWGVALLDDCKYGHKVKDNVLDLTLLRSVRYPGPKLVEDKDVKPGKPHDGYTDQCDHTFTYALYPHAGDHVDGGVVQEAHALNTPLNCVPVEAGKGSLPASRSLLSIDVPTVILEAVKQAEDGDDLIVRLYQSAAGGVRTTLRFGFPVKAAAETDLLERSPRALKLSGNAVSLSFAPFEIKTLRITRKAAAR